LRQREKNVKLKLRLIVSNKREKLKHIDKNRKLDVSKLKSSLNWKRSKDKKELKKLVKRT
jgi:hypothetical protein